MKKRTNRRVALLLPFALLSSFAFAGLPGSASAQTTAPAKVVDFETIAGALNADGSLARVRLLDDLRVYGTGNVTVVDPQPTTGLRNLLGYSGPTAVGGNEVRYSVHNLNGSKQFLTVSTPNKNPPVEMSIAYTLNGQSVSDGADLVGKTGDVGMSFTVKNVTSRLETVSYENSAGDTQTTQMQVPLPLVAQLEVTLPPDVFTRVSAPGADVVTDAFGNKILNWSLVLIPPIGDVTQTVTLQARAESFSLGPVRLAAAPVAPKDRNYLDFAENQFSSGVEQAGSLYSGATQIADNLDSVHDGTLKLLGGIQKLYAGAQKLAAGLNDAIAPAGQLMAGIGKLKGGLQGLVGGLNQVKTGIPAGSAKLATGVSSLDSGLAAIRDCLTGTGKAKCQGHAIAGSTSSAIVPQLELGLSVCLLSTVPGICQGNHPVGYIVQSLKGAIDACLPSTGADSCGSGPSIHDLATAASQYCAGDATCLATTGGIQQIADSVAANADQALDGIVQLLNGLLHGSKSSPGIIGGLEGISQIADGLSAGIGGSPSAAQVESCERNSSTCTVRSGLAAILAGVKSGFEDLLAGLGSDSPGAVQACVADSSKCTLLSGEGAVLNGLGQLQTGLQTGLGQAAAGASTIATCIGAPGNECQGGPSLKGGVSQLEQGVYAINELGVKEVGRQANDTQGTIESQLAVMHAEDKRAQSESLLYGPPRSSQAQTVVGGSSVILTMDALDGRKSESVSRGIYAAIALLLLVGLGLLGMRGTRRPAA
jgi:putative membrane protein